MLMFALAAMQGLSALKQADEINMSADLTNKLNEVNAKYAEDDAYNAEQFGVTESAAYAKNIDQTIGSQRAGFASEGVDVGFGTAAQIQGETRLTGALNILDLQNQARQKALGYMNQARNIRQGMSVARSQAEINANTTATTGLLNAGATGYRAYTQLPSNSTGLKGTAEGTSNRVASNGKAQMSGPGPQGDYHVESELASKGYIGSTRLYYRTGSLV